MWCAGLGRWMKTPSDTNTCHTNSQLHFHTSQVRNRTICTQRRIILQRAHNQAFPIRHKTSRSLTKNYLQEAYTINDSNRDAPWDERDRAAGGWYLETRCRCALDEDRDVENIKKWCWVGLCGSLVLGWSSVGAEGLEVDGWSGWSVLLLETWRCWGNLLAHF